MQLCTAVPMPCYGSAPSQARCSGGAGQFWRFLVGDAAYQSEYQGRSSHKRDMAGSGLRSGGP